MNTKKTRVIIPCVTTLLVTLEDDEEDVATFIAMVKEIAPTKVLETDEDTEYEQVQAATSKWEATNSELGEHKHPYILVVPKDGPQGSPEDAAIDGTHFDVARITVITDEEEREEYVDNTSQLCYLNQTHFRNEGESIAEFVARLFK
jgi:hypothetical protein